MEGAILGFFSYMAVVVPFDWSVSGKATIALSTRTFQETAGNLLKRYKKTELLRRKS